MKKLPAPDIAELTLKHTPLPDGRSLMALIGTNEAGAEFANAVLSATARNIPTLAIEAVKVWAEANGYDATAAGSEALFAGIALVLHTWEDTKEEFGIEPKTLH